MARSRQLPEVAQKQQALYDKSYEKYDKYSLEELKSMWDESTKDKSKRISGGSNKRAFMDVVSNKLQNNSIKEGIQANPDIQDNIVSNLEDNIKDG